MNNDKLSKEVQDILEQKLLGEAEYEPYESVLRRKYGKRFIGIVSKEDYPMWKPLPCEKCNKGGKDGKDK